MKTRRAIFLVAGITMLVFAQLGGWAQEKYVPKENEELFGRWKDDKVADQQTVYYSAGFKIYFRSTDNILLDEATQEIEKKWTDTQGNIWYKTLGLFVGKSPHAGSKFQALYEVDNSKTELTCWVNTVYQYDSSKYPPESNPKADYEFHYHFVEQ